jgi:hypothetical protein
MPKHGTLTAGASKKSTEECSLYYAEQCKACGRHLLYCATSSHCCVCNDRCPACGRPVLLPAEEHWTAKTLLHFFTG